MPATAGSVEKRLGVGLVVAAIVVFWMVSTYGITSPFYYGHYGYHGGSYATWARGTLRHHTLYPVNEPGFAPPRPAQYYVHHPVLTHQLVSLTFALFGQHEWTVRLGALLPSFASLLLVAAIGWRFWTPLAGGAAALAFAVVPINVWYQAHIDQGFPSIAFLLGFFWFYLGWLRNGRWRTAAAALACQVAAGNFEWSPYFAALLIFGHVAWTGVKRRGRYLRFAALYPVAVIVPLGFHFWLVARAGLLDDLAAAYRNRTSDIAYSAFRTRMVEYADTLFGPALLVVMGAWLVLAVARFARGRGRSVDLVGFTFAGALIVYMHVFKNAVVTHAYRQLYGNVWAAMAVGGLVAEVRPLGGRLLAAARFGGERLRGSLAALTVAFAVLGLTAPVSWAGLIESRMHGGVPGWSTFNPDLRQTALAMRVAAVTTPADELYLHSSFAWPPPHRMDWAFYYDRNLHRWSSLRALTRLSAAERTHAVAVLFPNDVAGDEAQALAELTAHHTLWLVDGMAMLDLRAPGGGIQAYRLVPVDRGWMGHVARLDKQRRQPATGAAGPMPPAWGPGASFVRRWMEGPYPAPRLERDPTAEVALTQRLAKVVAPSAAVAPAPRVAPRGPAAAAPVRRTPARGPVRPSAPAGGQRR